MAGMSVVLQAPTVSAGGAVTIGHYDHIYIKDATSGESGQDWDYGVTEHYQGYSVNNVRAWAGAKSFLIAGAQVYGGVYKEVHFKDGAYGYYTAKMTGTYAGKVYYTSWIPAMGKAQIWWVFRIIDLNNVRPNYIVAETQVKYLEREISGSQTISGAFTASLTWYMSGDCASVRYGLEAYVMAKAEGWGPTDTQANAYQDGGSTFGIWYSQIEVQAPCPGPGCVLEGTPIMLADGSMAPVEALKRNTPIMGYDLQTSSLVSEKVTYNKRTVVDKIEIINGGLLKVTPTNQPIYAKHGSFTGWVIDPKDLKVGWELLNPVTGEWVSITSIEFQEGSFLVYDLGATAPNNFIANGLLLDRKPIR